MTKQEPEVEVKTEETYGMNFGENRNLFLKLHAFIKIK